MKISSEGRFDLIWIDEISEILRRNRNVRVLNISIIVIAFLSLSYAISIEKFWHFIIGVTIFLSLIVLVSIFNKKLVSIEFSEILSYYLCGLLDRIERFDGKKEYIANEGIKITKKINNLISDFLDSAESETYKFFNFYQISNTLNKLEDQMKKSYFYFKFFDSNKQHKEEFKEVISKLSLKIYKEKDIKEEYLRGFESLPLKRIDLINEGFRRYKELFSVQIKKYFKLIIFSFLVIFCIGYIVPFFFPNVLNKSIQITLILTIIGTAFASELFGKK